MTDRSRGSGRAGRGAITMARHGRPALSRREWLSAKGWTDWWAAYDRSGLAEGETPMPVLVDIASESDFVVSSTLQRARETARLVAPGREFEEDALFVEAPLPAPRLPGWLKMRPAMWGVLSRIVWWFGYHGGGESRRMAEARAEQAASRLEILAEHGDVLLCAHGWFNRMVGRVLRRRGWRRVYDGGDRYWAWRRYHPPRQGRRRKRRT